MSLIGIGSVRKRIIPKRANNPMATPVLNLNALKLNPSYSDAYIQLGIIYQGEESNAKALESFKKAIEIDPENRNNYFPLINYFIVIKDFDQAVIETKKTIDSDPDDADGYYKLSIIYLEKENYLKSFLQLTNAIVKKKSFPEYYVLDFDGITRMKLADMYIKRAEISYKLNSKELMCEDYNMSLNLIEDNLVLKNKIKSLILENCK